jgi:hypothetical protein
LRGLSDELTCVKRKVDQCEWSGLEYRNTFSMMTFGYKDWPAVPTYQPDFFGWGLRTIDRVGDWLSQDEINLIMGGTAAKIYKLPVPHPRMFPEGRPVKPYSPEQGSDWPLP